MASKDGHNGDPPLFSRPPQASKPYLFTVLKPTSTTLSSLIPAFTSTESISVSIVPNLWFLGLGLSIHLDEKLLGDWIHTLYRCSLEKWQEYLLFQTRIEIPAWPLTSLGKLLNVSEPLFSRRFV